MAVKYDFSGRVFLITGASGGIGYETARRACEYGAKVVNLDIASPAERMPGIRHIEADIADYSAVQRAVDDVLANEKYIDCLVNNAAMSRDVPLWKMSEEDWDVVIETNLKGAFNLIRHVAPHFRDRKYGKIVNITSINGMRGKFGSANYAASKAGLIGLTKTAARELGRFQVNVNAVAPGLVPTPLKQDVAPEYKEGALNETVLGRLPHPGDIANVILFLCSEGARHITGEVVKVDGGQYI